MAEKQSRISKMKHDDKNLLITQLKSEFRKSPLASNVCFSVILPFLEEDMEEEFECPCEDENNATFGVVYFVVPAVVVFLLSMSIQGFWRKKGSKNLGKTVVFSLFPPVLWIILLLMDGEIFACAMTTWSGNYEKMEKGDSKQWCKPNNVTSSQQNEYKDKAQELFSLSQVIGMGVIILLVCGFGVFAFLCTKKEVDRDPLKFELHSDADLTNDQSLVKVHRSPTSKREEDTGPGCTTELTMEEHQSKLPQTRDEYAQHVISQVKDELGNSPFVSNAFFGFALVWLEEFTEGEFACPCDAEWNSRFAAVYLVVPAVLLLLLMISMKCFRDKTDLKERADSCASILGPAIVWIIVVLWDGRTLACALTTWSGSYETLDEAAPQKWCEPVNATSSQEAEYKARTQRWFFMSQVIGMGLIITITAFSVVYLTCKSLCKGCAKCCRNKAKRDPDIPLQHI